MSFSNYSRWKSVPNFDVLFWRTAFVVKSIPQFLSCFSDVSLPNTIQLGMLFWYLLLPILILYIFTLFSLPCIMTVFLLAVLHSHCNHAQSPWQSSLVLFYGWMDWIYDGRMIPLDLLLRSAGTSTKPTIRFKDFVAPRPWSCYVCCINASFIDLSQKCRRLTGRMTIWTQVQQWRPAESWVLWAAV